MTNNSITLVPAGGLGNRMKAIAAAVSLAERCGGSLQVKWFQDWGLGCRFDQLFQPIPKANVSVSEASLLDACWADRPRKRNLYLPLLPQWLLFDRRMDEITATKNMQSGFDFAAWAAHRRVWIASNVYFMAEDPPKAAFALFRPIAGLQTRVDGMANAIGRNAVGVHIRRTDNDRAIAFSPTEAFVARMRMEAADTHFYVATDDENVKLQLRRDFPHRVHTLPRKAERGSLQGMEDAVVELYTLARCRRILGSSCSTYSMTAASIGDIPLETIERRDK